MQKLLAGQQTLPMAMRDHCIILAFREPVPEWRVSEFYRIRLSLKMLGGGEDDYYQPEIWQPDNVKRMAQCAICKESMLRQAANVTRCTNPKCTMYLQLIFGGPASGVIQTVIDPRWIVADEVTTFEDGGSVTHAMTSHVLLVLDRRYSENVVSQIKRCAFNLAEMCGMPLKD